MNPERWLALSARSSSRESEDLLATSLVELGGRAVIEEAGTYTTFLPAPPEPGEFATHARARLVELTGLPDVQVTWRLQAHRDWEQLWKRGLGPRRVSDRIIVAPTWDRPAAGPGEVVVAIDPGMAFGTAEHATTRGCLRLLDGAVAPGARIADVGCGSGILSIAAAMLGSGPVLALDSDPFACEAARENAVANDVSATVRVRCAPATAELLRVDGPFDGIVANIEWNALRELLPILRAALAPRGWLLLGGVLLPQVPDVTARSLALGFTPGATDIEEEWWSGLLRT